MWGPRTAWAAELEHLTLRNGVRVVLLPIEDSEHFTMITFVPLGLCDDDKGKAQWSHLVEHLVSSSTGAAPYDEINAETVSNATHFDFMRPAEHWQEGVDKHARWLSVGKFSQKDVEREVPRVIFEVNNVAATGHTSKFATAAWAQAVGYGVEHVDINAHLKGASARELTAYYREKFLTGRRPVIAISGKFDREALLEQLAARIGSLTLPKADDRASSKTNAPENVPTRVTWDLPTRHLIFYWPIPDLPDGAYAHLVAAEPALAQAWNQSPSDYRPAGSFVTVECGAEVAGRRYFVVGLRLNEPVDDMLAKAHKDAADILDRLCGENGQMRTMGRFALQMQSQQFSQLDLVFAQTAGRNIPRRLVEGNLALFAGDFEFRHNGKFGKYLDVLSGAKDADARKVLQEVLPTAGRRELLIETR
jgi:hypothetical protein